MLLKKKKRCDEDDKIIFKGKKIIGKRNRTG